LLKVIDGLKPKPFALIGIIDDDHRKLGKFVGSCQVIGSSEQLLRLVQENNISEIIVSITGEMLGGMFQALLDAQEVGVDIVRMPPSMKSSWVECLFSCWKRTGSCAPLSTSYV